MIPILQLLYVFSYIHHQYDTSRSTGIRPRHTDRSSRFFAKAIPFSDQVKSSQSVPVVEIFDHVGSGSYGTVHFVKLLRGNGDEILVGKRAWTPIELQQQNGNLDSKQLADKSSRCLYYWMVEKHCFQKIPPHKGLPFFRGVGIDEEKRQWILSNKIQHGQELAISLQDYLEKDRLDHKAHRTHHLYWLSLSLLKESQAESTSENSLAATLDIFFQQLLEILSHIHEHSIVHRDIKPANLLVADGQLVLIDFGSAADLETAGLLQPNIGLSDRVAISPIYVAPELFVDPNSKCACNFDCFSAALLFCQLLFQFLDERTESGFHQQLKSADYDLDTWLQTALSSKVRPAGIDDALEVLEERPGLWKLLNGMLQKDPHARLSSKNALKLWSKICQNAKNRHLDEKLENELDDGLYLKSVLESLQVCEIPKLWPLHFVATFKRSESLGLYLAEADAEISESDDVEKWIKATKDASPGDVFVQAIVPGGQADQMGCFAVGDRLQGVGEIPISGGGFKKVVELLKDQPRSAKYVALHFDRLSAISDKKVNHTSTSSIDYPISISDKGAWTIKGRRKVQEDAYVLHEVHDDRDRSLLLAGVFDGHLGTTAANFLQKELPVSFCAAFKFGDDVLVDEIIEKAWNETCDAYRLICDNDEECKPYYDPREGTLMANTGSEDAVSGSTATVFAVDTQKGMIATLNCGDSRGIIVDSLGNTKFQTKDHKPEEEIERFLRGKEQGLDYCIPQCKVTRWTIEVGDYDYAVARSLEGPFATSKGVISLADVETIQAEPGMTIVIATDGLWEVIDIEETSRIVPSMRKRMKACDLAKHLCALAYEKSATDNVSVVILYVD